jgi:hypothetical protein
MGDTLSAGPGYLQARLRSATLRAGRQLQQPRRDPLQTRRPACRSAPLPTRPGAQGRNPRPEPSGRGDAAEQPGGALPSAGKVRQGRAQRDPKARRSPRGCFWRAATGGCRREHEDGLFAPLSVCSVFSMVSPGLGSHHGRHRRHGKTVMGSVDESHEDSDRSFLCGSWRPLHCCSAEGRRG